MRGTVMKSIETWYKGPTNYRGARIYASDCGDHRISIGYPDELSGSACHAQAALALARKLGWKGTFICGATKRGYAFVFENDERYDI
jgi:hypothetical protein